LIIFIQGFGNIDGKPDLGRMNNNFRKKITAENLHHQQQQVFSEVVKYVWQ